MADPLPLPTPAELGRALPAGPVARAVVKDARRAIGDVLHGTDRRRLVVIAGPCSLHDPEAALEYARLLARQAEAHRGELVVLMRTYFEKPRSSVGWKGLLRDPALDGSGDIGRGIELSRHLLLQINELGLPCATEFLDPLSVGYLEDLVSWCAIGARTAESQIHRELASRLRMPVGIKNGTSGSVEVARAALRAAALPHRVLAPGPDGVVELQTTPGNRDAHLVLRGGASGPNCDPASIAAAAEGLAAERPVVVDCSHDNSGRDPGRQGSVFRSVLRCRSPHVLGLMLESQLSAGRQVLAASPAALAYGVSITDACIGWDETAALLDEAAGSVRRGAG